MRLTHVTIAVKDQDKALEFYTKRLGLEKKADYQRPDSPRWLTVSPKGQDVQIVLGKVGTAPHLEIPANVPPSVGTRIVLEVEDCRKAFAELKARGVRFEHPTGGTPITEPVEEGWGLGAHFRDPDGNLLVLHQTVPPAQTNEWQQAANTA